MRGGGGGFEYGMGLLVGASCLMHLVVFCGGGQLVVLEECDRGVG